MSAPQRSVLGRLLYRHLPEEYRYRDNPTDDEFGDLEAYLDGFGHVLDLLRATLEQAYADGFSETADNGRDPQSWILSYLASSLGTELLAPDLDGTAAIRQAELGHAVSWSKGKGTLEVADSTANVMAAAETHVVEGWRRVAITPRLVLPPFSIEREAGRTLADVERVGSLAPLGCPDVRHASRPVLDVHETDPLQVFRLLGFDTTAGMQTVEEIHWLHSHRSGVPCFPGSYGDISVTTPDTRSRALRGLGPGPKRVAVYVQPPDGYFEPGLARARVTSEALRSYVDAHTGDLNSPVRIGPAELREIEPATLLEEWTHHRVEVHDDFEIAPGHRVILHDLNLMGKVTVRDGAFLELEKCAAWHVEVESPVGAEPSCSARHTIFDRLSASGSFVRLEYVTVIGELAAARLQASDCLFDGGLGESPCFDEASCVRYSCIPPAVRDEGCGFADARSNTFDVPRFVHVVTDPCAGSEAPPTSCCEVKRAPFGTRGCGVLDVSAPESIRHGSEDGMELGAYHALGFSARLAALARKFNAQLPLGQELDLRYDPMLSVRPPARATNAGGDG